jgi:hypothetical protein
MIDAFEPDQIAALNTARDVLRELEKQAMQSHDVESWRIFNYGKFSEACDDAEQAIFNVFNVAHAYLHVELTEEQMQNRKEQSS